MQLQSFSPAEAQAIQNLFQPHCALPRVGLKEIAISRLQIPQKFLLAEITSAFNAASQGNLSSHGLLQITDDKWIDLSAAPSMQDAELFLEAVVLHDNKINGLEGNSILIS